MSPPPASRIEVVEAPPDFPRLVLRVPAGSPHARSLLFAALFWNLISWTLAAGFGAGAVANGIDWGLVPNNRPNGPLPWFVLLFTGVRYERMGEDGARAERDAPRRIEA